MKDTVHFAIRAKLDSGLLAEAARKALAEVDSTVAAPGFRTQTELIDRVLRTERLLAFLSTAFGVTALLLAALGLGGLLFYMVARRTNEIGVRMALGASPGNISGMVVRGSLLMAGPGILVGLPCAWAVARLLRGMLYGLEPVNVPVAVAALGMLTVIALLAGWVPARRAARIDPIVALREE
jgi:ABC-type antimicrobial peptide transport system permease subunit